MSSPPQLGHRLRRALVESVEETVRAERACSRAHVFVDPRVPDPLAYACARWGWPVRLAPLLDVHAVLDRLPPWQLLLAEDIAHTSGQPVVVAAFPLHSSHAAGLIHRADDAVLIFLDVDQLPDADGLAAVMAHELGHALDPRFLAYTGEPRERFADDLGALLLRRRPETVTEADELVAMASGDYREAVRLIQARAAA